VNIALYAARSYVAQHGQPNSIAEFPDHAFLANETASDVRNGASALGLDPDALRIVLCSENSSVRHAALRAGMGIGASFCWLGDRDPNLIRILPDVTVATLPVWLVAHEDLQRSHALRRVFDGLRRLLPAALSRQV
jgi:DNA-binding transcriptional LysR family regulator